MNKATIIGMILVMALMVPGMASCSSVTTPSDSGATYTTLAQPTTVVVTKTVPVIVSKPTPPVVVNPHPAAPPPAPWWHNWRWPWHPRP